MAAAEAELVRVSVALDDATVSAEVARLFEQLQKALDADTDDWKALIPGKPLLATFAGRAQMSLPRDKALYIRQVATGEQTPFQEIVDLFAAIDQ